MTGIRRNARNLTAAQKQEFVSACYAVKANGAWDKLTLVHAQMSVMMTPAGSSRSQPHGGPAFLPWHRYFTYLMELELQKASGNSSLGIPYWDWTVDGASSSIWGDDFLGGNGDTSDGSYALKTGPFCFGKWTAINESGNPILYPDGKFTGVLKRRFGYDIGSLPTTTDLNTGLYIRTYDTYPWSRESIGSHRNALEGYTNAPQLHNRVHRWVGQSMRTNVAPNDPVFYLHHSQVDRIWARWQTGNGTTNYVPTGTGPYHHNAQDPMMPWDRTPASVLDYVRDLDYTYDALR